jgi:predicted nucleic acid-binding protein
MKLADTTFLIHWYGDVERAKEYKSDNNSKKFITTSLNIKEFMVGNIVAGQGPELTMHQIESEFDWLEIKPYIGPFGFEAAEIEAQLRNQGDYEEDLVGDILIGGAARDLQADVVTRNTDDFRMMPGVSVDRY